MLNIVGVIIVVATLVAAYAAGTCWSVRQRALRRLYAEDEQRAAPGLERAGSDSALARWLARAGYRRPNAPGIFVMATAACVGVGVVVSQIYRLILFRPLVDMVANVPGSAGDMLILVLQSGSVILFCVASLVPEQTPSLISKVGFCISTHCVVSLESYLSFMFFCPPSVHVEVIT